MGLEMMFYYVYNIIEKQKIDKYFNVLNKKKWTQKYL